jgi:hypothetical protein
MTNRVFCCLWKGTDLPHHGDYYGIVDVHRLARGVKRCVPDGELLVLADANYRDLLKDNSRGLYHVEPLQELNRGGWTNRLEVFHPWFRPSGEDRHVMLDLDTIMVGDCEWLFKWNKSPVGMPLDPFKKPMSCSTVVTFSEAGGKIIWDNYLRRHGLG